MADTEFTIAIGRRWPRAGAVLAVVGAGLAVLLAPLSASAQSNAALNRQIERLQRELNDLQLQVRQQGGGAPVISPNAPGGGAGGLSPSVRFRADMEVRMTQLETELRKVTGQAEELDHAIAQLNQRLEKLSTDLEFRLGRLEQAAGLSAAGGAGAMPAGAPQGAMPAVPGAAAPPPPGVPPTARAGRPAPDAPPANLGTVPRSAVQAPPPPAASATAATTPGLPPGTPKEQYDYAFASLRKQEYEKAESAFLAFLKAHPKDKLAGNAHYWLGRTYFIRGNYQQAAFAFAEGFEKFPTGSKAPDNLMNLGMALAKLDKTEQACTAFARLGKNFPNASATVKQRVDREMRALKCR